MWLDPLLNIRKCFPFSSPQVSRRTERAAIVRLSPAGSSKLWKCSHLLQPSSQRNKALIRYLLCIVIVNHVQWVGDSVVKRHQCTLRQTNIARSSLVVCFALFFRHYFHHPLSGLLPDLSGGWTNTSLSLATEVGSQFSSSSTAAASSSVQKGQCGRRIHLLDLYCHLGLLG